LLLAVVPTFIASAAISSRIGELVAVIGISVAGLALLRGFRISLVADHEHIVVRNYLRTYDVRWDQVETIGVGLHHAGGIALDALAIQLRGRGSVITVQATISGSREIERVRRALAQLRPDLPIRFPD